jgi:hypothetical protein
MENFAQWWFLSMLPSKTIQHLTFWDHVNYVKLCEQLNHGYKFCLTSCSQMRLRLARMVLPMHGVRCQCHFWHQFSVNTWGGVLGSYPIESCLIEGLWYRHTTGIFWRMNYHCFKRLCLFKLVVWLQHDIIPPQSRREAVEFSKKLGCKMDKMGWTIGLSHTVSWLAH